MVWFCLDHEACTPCAHVCKHEPKQHACNSPCKANGPAASSSYRKSPSLPQMKPYMPGDCVRTLSKGGQWEEDCQQQMLPRSEAWTSHILQDIACGVAGATRDHMVKRFEVVIPRLVPSFGTCPLQRCAPHRNGLNTSNPARYRPRAPNFSSSN